MAVSPNHDVNIAETRLRESAIRLFAERGYSATSIREIIENAGVTRPVLYYYFKNKEALFTGLVERQFEEVCDELDEILARAGNCRDRLLQFTLRAFKRTQEAPDMVRMLLHFFFSPPIPGLALNKEELGRKRFERIVTIMKEGIDQGELDDHDPAVLAFSFSGIVDMCVMAWVSNPQAPLTEDLANTLVDLFLRGAARTNASGSTE